MSEQKKFNLLRYVYGELFLSSLSKTIADITIDSWKANAWRNILNWLCNNEHISGLKIEYVSPKKQKITYIFNHKNIIYPNYLKYLQRLVDDTNIKLS